MWNSNQMVEAFVGFGAKNVTIEYSVDGATWTTLDGVPEFARATAMPTYTANTTVAFGGVTAKYVKLTINSNWGGLSAQVGLSEVRFFYVPVQARNPQPAVGATGVALDTELTWRPGREAPSHKVYFGTDQQGRGRWHGPGQTVTDHSFTPGALNFGTTYYWKVDEIGDGRDPTTGEVWSFTTREYAAIDDFESYNDDDNRIYDAWIDGLINSNGSHGRLLRRPRSPSGRSSTAASSRCRSSTTTSRRRSTARPSGSSRPCRTGPATAPTA